MRPMNFILTIVLAAELTFAAPVSRAGPVVVVARSSSVDTLTADQVARIFLGKTESFPNGTRAVPIDQAEDSPLRQSFYEWVTGKTPAQLKAYWSRIIFSGKGEPPRRVADSKDAIRLLQSNPNAVAYIDQAEVTANLKVVYAR
jgi:ABC-type phosphate transport system substrate-binding protein